MLDLACCDGLKNSVRDVAPASEPAAAPPGRTVRFASAVEEAEGEDEEVELEDAQWMPGEMLDLYAGGAEAQQCLEAAHDMDIRSAVILWSAPWAESAAAAGEAAARALAGACPGNMVLCIDVDASSDNKRFAYEKVRRHSSPYAVLHAVHGVTPSARLQSVLLHPSLARVLRVSGLATRQCRRKHPCCSATAATRAQRRSIRG
jgi:hypothetical protein